jgi:hypothetical protein
MRYAEAPREDEAEPFNLSFFGSGGAGRGA